MAVSENDKKIVLDAMRDLGAKDDKTSRNVELITGKTRSKGPRYADKQLIAAILQTLQNERKVIRKAGEKTASYYIAPVQPAAPKPVTPAPVVPAPQLENPFLAPEKKEEKKSDNPYL